MFGWFKKKKEKQAKEEYVAHAIWKVTADGDIWLDFGWNNDKSPDAARMFAETFVMITGGDLIQESLDFIKEKLVEEDREGQYEALLNYIAALQYQRAKKLFPELLSRMEETPVGEVSDPVIKPSEIVTKTTGFKHSGL